MAPFRWGGGSIQSLTYHQTDRQIAIVFCLEVVLLKRFMLYLVDYSTAQNNQFVSLISHVAGSDNFSVSKSKIGNFYNSFVFFLLSLKNVPIKHNGYVCLTVVGLVVGVGDRITPPPLLLLLLRF